MAKVPYKDPVEAGYPSLEFDGLDCLFGPREMAADVRARRRGYPSGRQ